MNELALNDSDKPILHLLVDIEKVRKIGKVVHDG